jgi:hypothetical protein
MLYNNLVVYVKENFVAVHKEMSGDSEIGTGDVPDRGYLQDTHVRWYKTLEVIGGHRGKPTGFRMHRDWRLRRLGRHLTHNKSTTAVMNLQGGQI